MAVNETRESPVGGSSVLALAAGQNAGPDPSILLQPSLVHSAPPPPRTFFYCLLLFNQSIVISHSAFAFLIGELDEVCNKRSRRSLNSLTKH